MLWPKTRQQDEYRRHSRRALRRLQRWIRTHEDQILVSGEGRMLGVGFDEYGETSWLLTFPELEEALLEELSDAVVYQVIKQAKGWT